MKTETRQFHSTLKNKIACAMLFFLSIFSVGDTFATSSLEWQKIRLEEKINRDIDSSISKLIKSHEYLVKINIDYSNPGMPNFDDMEQTGLKVSDVEFDDSKGGYIAFSKVGLEVPVVEKYYKDNQRKLKELYRYNESFDLFKNLQKVEVVVFLSEDLKKDLITKVQNLLNNMKLSYGNILANFRFEVLPIERVIETPIDLSDADELTLKDILNLLARFGNAIGLIVATLLFGLLTYLLMKKYWELKAAADTPNQEEIIDAVEDESDENDDVVAATEISEDERLNDLYQGTSEENFERLRLYYKNSTDECVLMIKKWINSTESNSEDALRAVAQQFEDDELIQLFHGLEREEREKWKACLDKFLDKDEIKVANKFISEEVTRNIIAPSFVQDTELVNLLLSIDLNSACKFIREFPFEGKILMNLLNSQFVGKIIDELDEDEAESIIQESLMFDFSQVKDDFEVFKSQLNSFWQKSKSKPFNQKLLQMLPDFNPTKESMVYEFLAKSKMKAEMTKMACENLPSTLIESLPRDIIRSLMQNYPNEKKVQLLYTVDKKLSKKLMNAFAEKGSAARDILDMEFSNLNSDELAAARIKNGKEEVWREFISFTRNMIKSSEQYSAAIEPVVLAWVGEMIETHDSPAEHAS